MKKFSFLFSLLAFAFLFSTAVTHAQSYEKGTKVFNLGVGVGGYYDFGFGSPGVSASFEVGGWKTGDFGVIGLGAYGGARFILNEYIEDYAIIAVGPRATYHFTVIPVEDLDVYAAVQIVFIFATYEDALSVFSSFNSGAIVGTRYYFSENFGVFAELGYNLNYLTAGISLQF